jgi:trans-aconitate 2-methyltransferase
MTTDTWNAAQYNRFQREREQPFVDLMHLVEIRPGMRVVDLGCGTGELTRRLHEHLGARETLGIDRSPNMLTEHRSKETPNGLRFEVGTIESFPPPGEAFDVIFSNAALHWIADHERLLKRLADALAPSGQLLFQIPASHGDDSHQVADDLIELEPYRTAAAGWRRPNNVLSPEAYSRILYALGFHDPKVRLIVYPHVLAGPESVLDWMRGTLLTEYARHLPPDVFESFVRDYWTRLSARLEDSRPFFFPFKRIVCWGQRA